MAETQPLAAHPYLRAPSPPTASSTNQDHYLPTKLALALDPHPRRRYGLRYLLQLGHRLDRIRRPFLTRPGRHAPPTSCSHHRQAYNVAKSSPVLQARLGQSPRETLVNPFELNDHNQAKNVSFPPRQGDIKAISTMQKAIGAPTFAGSIGSITGCPITQQIVRYCSLRGTLVFTGCIGLHERCR
jgi:hypothetical protein